MGLEWQKYVKFDERYLRPTEVDALVGDASKAEKALGWKPKVLTPELAAIMVDADQQILEHEGQPWTDRPFATNSPEGGLVLARNNSHDVAVLDATPALDLHGHHRWTADDQRFRPHLYCGSRSARDGRGIWRD